jgi:hypothetical protein
MPFTTGYNFGDVERRLVLKKLGQLQQVDVGSLRTSLDLILG